MATKTKDTRLVHVTVTNAELTNLISAQAKAAALIDFDPDRVEVLDQGDENFEIIFQKDTQ